MSLSRQQLSTVIVLLAGSMLVVLNQTLLSPALPTIMRDMDISRTTVQWAISIYSLTEAIVIPLSAFVMGLAPVRKIFTVTMILYAAGTALCAASPNFAWLLVGRVIEACGTGILMPMSMAAILTIFPREKRGSAMGLVSLIIGIAPAVGPALGGYLTDTMGWRESFIIVTIISIVIFIIACIFLNWDHQFETSQFDFESVVLSSLGLGGILWGFSNISSGSHIALTLCAIAAGSVLVYFFVRRQSQLKTPMLRVEILKTRNFAVDVIICMIIEGIFVGGDTLMTLYVQNVLGQSATIAGLVMMPCALSAALASLYSGRAYDRTGAHKLIVRFAPATFVGGFLMFFFDGSASVLYVTIIFALMEFGLCISMTPIQTWGFNSLPNSAMQHATPLQNTLNQVAAAFGTALFVSASDIGQVIAQNQSTWQQNAIGYQITFALIAIISMITIVIAIKFVSDKKTASERTKAKAQNHDAAGESPDSITHVIDATMKDIPARQFMHEHAFTVRENDTVGHVAQMFIQDHTSGLPVVDAHNRVVGFISDGDVMQYLGDKDYEMTSGKYGYQVSDDQVFSQRIQNLLNLNVMAIATKHVISVSPDESVGSVSRILAIKRIKKVPVVDDDNRLISTVSRSDIIRASMQEVTEKQRKEADHKASASKESAKDNR